MQMSSDSDFPQTIPELLRYRAQQRPDSIACYHHAGEQGWVATIWSDYSEKVSRVAASLVSNGLGKGDHLGIIIPTCREWDIAEKAALSLGVVVVGIEPHAPLQHQERIIRHAGINALLVSDLEQLELLDDAACRDLTLIITLQDCSQDKEREERARVLQWRNIYENPGNSDGSTPIGSDPATIIFTSGTTGEPKGIVYTHRQCMLACQSLLDIFGNFTAADNVICWMPLANLFQRIMNLCAVGTGSPVYFVENPQQVMDYIEGVKPSVFIGVPRFYEKLWSGILEQIETMPVWQRVPASLSLDIAHRHASSCREGKTPSILLRLALRAADAVVLAKLRGIMGGRIQYMISGSAPCPTKVLEFFGAIGLPLLEAYGISENIVPVAANRPEDYRLGSVGKPLTLNQVKISADGEVLVKGEGLFSGYYHDAESAGNFTEDGFYATQDYGFFDEDGYLFLKGRKSEIIKTSTGRRIALNRVENVLRQIALVDQVVVVGSGRKSLLAIVALDPDRLQAQQAAKPVNIEALLAAEVQEKCRALAPYERVRGCLVTSGQFTIEAAELTPNLKFRRAVIEAHHAEDIDRLSMAMDNSAKEANDTAHEVPIILCQEK
jgi:long-chain acyl-CoA synthetase